MDYASLRRKLISLGLKKTKCNHCLLKFADRFESKNSEVSVLVNWEMGGFVRDVTVTRKTGATTYLYDRELVQSLIEALQSYLKNYN